MATMIDLSEARAMGASLLSEMARALVGRESLAESLVAGLIAGGHVLIEGVPGIAKTLAARALASASGLSCSRIQFTADLLPADLTGALTYDQRSGSFSARKGPVFANIVIADEINRAPAKVQGALLEAMEERKVTMGEQTIALPEPFMVLATQNPLEHEGTYPLPEAELDRFMAKVLADYPTAPRGSRHRLDGRRSLARRRGSPGPSPGRRGGPPRRCADGPRRSGARVVHRFPGQGHAPGR